ncbi:MAG: TIGR03087 family PEP-CTERM/XrtA system glycosyltransferase [Aquabacterium sp.]|nr:TIGR03087 family PEP-CTERM/XrtA system glycosyltransferase [Aquabacterium sp.]
MAKLLYLVHRLPYPPNKGDKVRSYHLLRHLAARHQVYLGTFVDDPDDLQHLPVVRGLCADLCAVTLAPRSAKLRSLVGLLTGEALTLRYYRSAALQNWVAGVLAHQQIDAAVVFSSSMAPYALAMPGLPMLADLVDVDSAKWTEYAGRHRWPMSWLYQREGERLLAYERSVVAQAQRSFLVTDKEVALFGRLAPESQGQVLALGNGVDADFFQPDARRPSPFAEREQALVFTGAMDYWPNVDAVCWFVDQVLPLLRRRWPGLRLHIVGRSPTPAVLALAGAAVQVTGTVPDVRPYLQHAAVVVAPLRLARGVQNKVLEAMAMARPVVAAVHCVEAIDAQPGTDILAATDAGEHAARIGELLADPRRADAIGRAGRACVLARYSWPARLAGIDTELSRAMPVPRRDEPEVMLT